MQALNTEKFASIKQWMQSNHERGRIAGSSLLLAQNGEIAMLHAQGKRSLAQDLPYEIDTLTRIYSMTKPVTSVVVMQLMNEGRLSLEQPVSDFLPAFSHCRALVNGADHIGQTEPVPPPSLFQLMVHTSGLTYGFNSGLLPDHYQDQGLNFEPESGPLQAMVQRIAQQPLAFCPGTRWEYSIGIDILGAVIEVITGQSLDQVFQDRIFDPLGMKDTFFTVPQDRLAELADCHVYSEEEPLKLFDAGAHSIFGPRQDRMFAGGGGLVSTLHDYFRFAEMLRLDGTVDGVEILPAPLLHSMKRNHLGCDIADMGPTSFAEMPMVGVGFGLGGAVVLAPERSGMAGSAGDFGWGGLAGTYFWIDPITQVTCIFFTQLIPSGAHPLRSELKALVHSALR
ncbi:MAG: beta-lactamase family protein [Thalassovita sp.]